MKNAKHLLAHSKHGDLLLFSVFISVNIEYLRTSKNSEDVNYS